MFEYQITDRKFKPNIKKGSKYFLFSYPGKLPDESAPYVVILPKGIYKIECWGSRATSGGNGGYTAGDLQVNTTLSVYLYIGTYDARLKSNRYPYNGGGAGDITGGGATDVRLFPGKWDDFFSLKSRIMVAAGAGSSDCDGIGGPAGGVNGYDAGSSYAIGKGATQINGGFGYVSGSFGTGGSYNMSYEGNRTDMGAGGGGGYYGGGTGYLRGGCGAGGGSSFISGYDGCNAIDVSSTEYNIIHTNQSIHYSGLFFNNAVMKDGLAEDMPLIDGTTGKGNKNKGAVRITFLTNVLVKSMTCRIANTYRHPFLITFMILINK